MSSTNRSRIARVALAAVLLATGCRAADPTQEAGEAEMTQRVHTQLMFEGQAEEAMRLYVSAVPDSRIVAIERYGPGEDGPEGSVKHAVFSLMGEELRCIDSFVAHEFTFTPAMSLFVTCRSEAELDALAAKLSEGGQTFMPLDSYGFSKRFTFFADRFGVSWQLNLPHD